MDLFAENLFESSTRMAVMFPHVKTYHTNDFVGSGKR